MKPVPLSEVLECMEFASDEIDHYVDTDEGTVVCASKLFDDDGTAEKAEEAGWPHLPDISPDDELRWMRKFARRVEDDAAREALLDAFDGPRPFRRFKDAAYRLGMTAAWQQYREGHVLDLLRFWLEEEQIAFIDDVARGRVPGETPPDT